MVPVLGFETGIQVASALRASPCEMPRRLIASGILPKVLSKTNGGYVASLAPEEVLIYTSCFCHECDIDRLGFSALSAYSRQPEVQTFGVKALEGHHGDASHLYEAPDSVFQIYCSSTWNLMSDRAVARLLRNFFPCCLAMSEFALSHNDEANSSCIHISVKFPSFAGNTGGCPEAPRL